jgi:hypothetical protein
MLPPTIFTLIRASLIEKICALETFARTKIVIFFTSSYATRKEVSPVQNSITLTVGYSECNLDLPTQCQNSPNHLKIYRSSNILEKL